MTRGAKRPMRFRRLLPFAAVAAIVAAAVTTWLFGTLSDPRDWFVDEHAYDAEIGVAAKRHGLDPELVRAVIYQESRFRKNRRGSRGEIGLMQVLPSGAAAEWARVKKRPRPTDRELFGVELNLEIGCWYLARALRRWREYDRKVELALAQYNAGEKRAREWAPKAKNGEVLPRVKIASTKKYIKEITERYRSYAAAAKSKHKDPTVGKK